VQTYHAQQLNLLLFGVPIVLLMPFVHFQEFSGFDTRTWLLFVFLGINTLVAYGCLAEAFKYIEANKVSMIITLNPVITFITMAILGAMQVEWIAHENFSGYSIAGALLVLSGALLVILSGRDKKG
jgi:drug/metabolite transporter (DMT)-like permease